MVVSPLPNIPPNAKVTSLIDPVSYEWRADVIHQLFLPHESKIILLGIPLSFNLPYNRLIWSKTPSGFSPPEVPGSCWLVYINANVYNIYQFLCVYNVNLYCTI